MGYLRVAYRNPGFIATVFLRLQENLHRQGKEKLATLVRNIALIWTGTDIGPGAQAGPGLLLPHPVGIVIGTGTVIGSDCTILQNVTLGERQVGGRTRAHPIIGDRVTIGAGACIVGPIIIGSDSVIGANAVVISDVPPRSLAVGVPARVTPLTDP